MDWGILPKVADHVLNLALISQTNFHGDPSLVINISTDGYEGFNVVKVSSRFSNWNYWIAYIFYQLHRLKWDDKYSVMDKNC